MGVFTLMIVEVGDCFYLEGFVKDPARPYPSASVLKNGHVPRIVIHALSPRLVGNQIWASRATHSWSIGITG